MEKKNLLLHTCCATCLCYVYELLSPSYTVESYYYNPNIAPGYEYHKRLKDVETFCSMKGLPLRVGDYDIIKWKRYIRPYRFNGEKSERCLKCFEARFEKTFEVAKVRNMDIVTSTLSISPHKNASKINDIGRELSQKYGVEFLESDFKKQDGFKRASELADEYGFYKQNYCGCIYSKMEREVNSRGR